MSDSYVTLDLVLFEETDKAYKLAQAVDAKYTRHWVPKSLCLSCTKFKSEVVLGEVVRSCRVKMAEWKAEQCDFA